MTWLTRYSWIAAWLTMALILTYIVDLRWQASRIAALEDRVSALEQCDEGSPP